MADASELVLLSGATALINAVYSAQHGHDVVGSVAASGFSFLALTALGGLWREDVAIAIAGLLFFAALILRGLPLLTGFTNISEKG